MLTIAINDAFKQIDDITNKKLGKYANMMPGLMQFMYPKTLSNLIESFKLLPGIGEKTARTSCFCSIAFSEEECDKFSKNIENSKHYPMRDFIKSVIKERLNFFEKNAKLIKLLLIEMQYSPNLKEQTSNILFPKVFEALNYMKKLLGKN